MPRTTMKKNSSDDDDPPKLRTFSCAKLSLLLGILYNTCNEILGGDPTLRGSWQFKRALMVAALPYVGHIKDISRQT
jgi:hypothetical protein